MRTSWSVAILSAALAACPGAGQNPAPTSNLTDQLVKQVASADTPYQAATAYRLLFRDIKADELRHLQTHMSDSVAIQAAWQEVELTVPQKEAKGDVRPDRAKLAWFVGFLEGRGRVSAPPWWAEAILDARANRRGNVYAGGLKAALSEPKGTKTSPPTKAVLRTDMVVVGSASAPIPTDLREKVRYDTFRSSAALITPKRCYVAAYDPTGGPYRLACVDLGMGRTRWVTEVWDSWWWDTEGTHIAWVEVTEQGDRVVVFGVATMGFHVEAFRADNGAALFRFSNGYSAP